MEPAPVVHPADINPATDGSGQRVLALTLPRHAAGWFLDDPTSVAVKCSVYRLPADFFVGFVVLQARSHQVRVVIPLYNEKSFSWLEQCRSVGSVSCVFVGDGVHDGRQFDFPVELPISSGPSVLNEVYEIPDTAAQDVLLVIASSVPGISQPGSVASLFADIEVEEVSVCIVRDFFNTNACKLAAAELLGSQKKAPAVGTPFEPSS